eukprot:g32465.t1
MEAGLDTGNGVPLICLDTWRVVKVYDTPSHRNIQHSRLEVHQTDRKAGVSSVSQYAPYPTAERGGHPRPQKN